MAEASEKAVGIPRPSERREPSTGLVSLGYAACCVPIEGAAEGAVVCGGAVVVVVWVWVCFLPEGGREREKTKLERDV